MANSILPQASGVGRVRKSELEVSVPLIWELVRVADSCSLGACCIRNSVFWVLPGCGRSLPGQADLSGAKLGSIALGEHSIVSFRL